MNQPPTIEYLSQSKPTFRTVNTEVINPKNKPARVKIFLCSLLIFLLIAIIINYSRPATFQSNATILTSAAVAIDKKNVEADFQHVVIQKQKILGYEILKNTLEQLNGNPAKPLKAHYSLSDLQKMLKVEIINQTNLVKLIAEGTEAKILPVVINTWIESYLQARSKSVKNSTDGTIKLIENELAELKIKINQARQSLDKFRKNHDISSIVREENDTPSILKGLTESYNKAREEVIISKAKLDAINQSIASGESLVPDTDQTTLSNLEKRHQELSEQLAEFDTRFTRDYLLLQPALKFIPEQIKELEKQIKSKKNTGKNIVWTQANQEYLAAQQVEQQISQQLMEHKKNTAKFTTLFAEHQTLINDLESLELINRETKDRLAKIESKQFDRYPQVEIVEPASINFEPIRPDYQFGAIIAAISALMMSFFTVWLVEYLYRERGNITDVNYPLSTTYNHLPQNTGLPENDTDLLIYNQSKSTLPQSSVYQKIPQEYLALLIDKADKNAQQLCFLLLSGLTITEIAELQIEHINLETSSIHVPNATPPRSIKMGNRTKKTLLESSVSGNNLWTENRVLSDAELNAVLYCAQVDLALNELAGNLADRIRQTYIIYLVEQGTSLAGLAEIVGYLSPLELAGYASFALPEKRSDIEHIHPLCS